MQCNAQRGTRICFVDDYVCHHGGTCQCGGAGVSQMTVSQMSIQNITPSPQQRQHWLSANVYLIHQ
jgi:hypothetical protein